MAYDPKVKMSLTRLAKETELHKKMVNNGLVPCCLSCEHFNERRHYCDKFQAYPPAETIVFGCEHWDMGIPF